MRVISFKNTALFKRGIWLSAAALVVVVAAPATLDGSLWRTPLPSAMPLAILCVALIYLLCSTQMLRLADQVLDCGDRLMVRRGRLEETILLSQISAAEVSSSSGFQRITIRLRQPARLGSRIEFLPQASLWSNIGAIKNVALDLTERARSSGPRAL